MRRLTKSGVLLTIVGLPLAGPAHATLYDDLGAQPGVARIVAGAVTRFLADRRISATFDDTNMDRFARLLTAQICQLAEGPCQYHGRDMAAAHRALKLDQAQFNALAEDVQDAMTEVRIGYHTQNRLLALLAPMQRQVVSQ